MKQFNKQLYILLLVCVCTVLNACKKSGSAPPADIRTLHVLEFKTNSPIANADVYLHQCIHPDPYGCLADSVVAKLTTDKNGSFQYNAKSNFYLITASQSNYWDGSAGGNFTGLGDVVLIPLAYTKIHLKKIKSHPAELMLHIILDTDPSQFNLYTHPYGEVIGSYDLVDDSSVIMKSYGNYDNSISWDFTDKAGNPVTTETGGSLPDYYINRFDTATAEVDY